MLMVYYSMVQFTYVQYYANTSPGGLSGVLLTCLSAFDAYQLDEGAGRGGEAHVNALRGLPE